MAGKVGRSGRRSLSDEAARAAVRQLAWQRTGEMLQDEAVKKYGLPKVCGIVATPIVKADMAKPIVIDQSENHMHITTVHLESMTEQELLDFTLGRKNGQIRKPEAAGANQA